MPIDASGRFIPDQQPQQRPMGNQPSAPMQPLAQNMQRNMAVSAPRYQNQLALQPPQQLNMGRFASMAGQPSNPYGLQAINQNPYGLQVQGQRPLFNPNLFNAGGPQFQQPNLPRFNMNPTPGQSMVGYHMNQPNQLGAQQPQMFAGQQGSMAPVQSVEQSVESNNPQSVQNFMSALQRVGAGGNNNMMNAPGQLGAGAQAGFMGFGSNGMQSPDFIQQGYTGPMQSNLQAQQNLAGSRNNFGTANQAGMNQNYNINNAATQGQYGSSANPYATQGIVGPGGTGGLVGQPTYQQPLPWGQPGNAVNPNGPAEDLFAPTTPALGGSMYSVVAPNTQGYTVSDINAKTNISDAQFELEDFLNKLGVYSYEYKNPEHGDGRYISPMAQEFEASNLGKQAVIEDANGLKMVNYGRLAGIQTAALALLNQKYNALESKFNEAMKTNIRGKRGNK